MDKNDIFKLIILNVLILAFSIFWCVTNYKYANLDYNDLVTIEGEFISYTDETDSRDYNIIILSNGSKIGFRNNVIEDENIVKEIKPNSYISLLCLETKRKDIDYELIEFKSIDSKNVDILNLTDYHNLYNRLFTTSIIVGIALLGFINFFMIVIPKLITKSYNKKIYKDIDYESEDAKKYISSFDEIVKYDGNKYYGYFDGEFDEENSVEYFCKYMDDKLSNNEFLLIHDEEDNDEFKYCLYKNQNRIAMFIIFKNMEELNVEEWIIDEIMVSFSYPKYSELTEKDKEEFINDLEYFKKKQNMKIVIEKE